MQGKLFLPSLTRISSLDSERWEARPLPVDEWEGGDYVLCEAQPRDIDSLELSTGRLVSVARGDRFIGALGDREATLEATGTWRDLEDGEPMDLLSSAGLLGKLRSKAPFLGELMQAHYRGHVFVGGEKQTMEGSIDAPPPRTFETPTILLMGTSMSSGKTTAGRTIVRRLKRTGRRVLAAKLTGAGRNRDMLEMHDAGADSVLDFVDAGMPSTVQPPERYGRGLDILLSKMAHVNADVVVAEIGASPLAAYNGRMALERLGPAVRLTALAASDFYGVLGMRAVLDLRVDFVCGPATNTSAGVELVREYCGLPALNLAGNGDDERELDRLLEQALID